MKSKYNKAFFLFQADGKWTGWTGWTKCSVTCSLGKLTRSRTCIGPKYGGKSCVGSSSEDKSCYVGNCPGMYSNYNNLPSMLRNESFRYLKTIRISKGIHYTGLG